MELWNKIMGTVRLELTAADPERLLNEITSRGIMVWNAAQKSTLCIEFCLARKNCQQVRVIAQKHGGKISVLHAEGLFGALSAWKKRPILIFTVLLLCFASVYVPGRILFVQVEGNATVPSSLIRETASRFGLGFGASRRGVRSELLKNELLGAIDALEWVGVNTSGCVATISVREGQPQPEEASEGICNLVASSDGVIDSVCLTKGKLLCKKGQTVRKGQILVSGYKDLGICTRAVEAEAEIYALTRRSGMAVLPLNTICRGRSVEQITKYSLIIGKKRINLSSDSGILPTTCGKMTEEIPLRLPGGWTLPVTLVVERYTRYEVSDAVRGESEAGEAMAQAVRRELLQESIAAEVLAERSELLPRDGCYLLQMRYECREMIARRRSALDMEGDTNDDPENGERGTG